MIYEGGVVYLSWKKRYAARAAELKIRPAKGFAAIAARRSRIPVRNAEPITQRANAFVASAAQRSDRPCRLPRQRNQAMRYIESIFDQRSAIGHDRLQRYRLLHE